MTSNPKWVPGHKQPARETKGTGGVELPSGHEFGEGKESRICTAHSFLKKYHVRLNQEEKGMEAALFGLTSKTSNIE